MKLLEPSEYQAAAAQAAASVSAELKTLFPTSRVEHVGASSIPGAISKGDVDICVVVDPARHSSVVQKLQSIGYVVKGNTLRTPEICMLLSPRTDLDIALQIVAQGSRFEFFMRFRDALCASPCLVDQYNAVKRNASRLSPEQYRDAKTAFIESVLGLV